MNLMDGCNKFHTHSLLETTIQTANTKYTWKRMYERTYASTYKRNVRTVRNNDAWAHGTGSIQGLS